MTATDKITVALASALVNVNCTLTNSIVAQVTSTTMTGTDTNFVVWACTSNIAGLVFPQANVTPTQQQWTAMKM